MLSRPQLLPSGEQLGQSFSSTNTQVCETVNSQVYFYFLPLFPQKIVGSTVEIISSLRQEWTNDGSPKHSNVLPTQRGPPQCQTARGPRIRNANGKEKYFNTISTHPPPPKKQQGVLCSARLNFNSSRQHQSGETLGALPVSEIQRKGFSPQPQKSLPPYYNPAVSPSCD